MNKFHQISQHKTTTENKQQSYKTAEEQIKTSYITLYERLRAQVQLTPAQKKAPTAISISHLKQLVIRSHPSMLGCC